MNSREFVAELERSNEEILARMGPQDDPHTSSKADLLVLLRIALKNELEATELAARWMPSTPELDVKLGLARQVGDEAKHYRLLEARYRELGGKQEELDPGAGGYSALFEYLAGLSTSVERLAAGQFTREALAQRRNEMFIEYLIQIGDSETARIYQEIIQPDEGFHHELGKTMLLKYAITPELQQAAREACSRTLQIAEKLRAGAIAKTGIYQIPGC
jgi:1,2-phenylacetyl-CoA epoxidase catalytic subunit